MSPSEKGTYRQSEDAAEPVVDEEDAAVEDGVVEGLGGVGELVGLHRDAGSEEDGADLVVYEVLAVADLAVENVRETLAAVIVEGKLEADAGILVGRGELGGELAVAQHNDIVLTAGGERGEGTAEDVKVDHRVDVLHEDGHSRDGIPQHSQIEHSAEPLRPAGVLLFGVEGHENHASAEGAP